jgi:hypothetical protein
MFRRSIARTMATSLVVLALVAGCTGGETAPDGQSPGTASPATTPADGPVAGDAAQDIAPAPAGDAAGDVPTGIAPPRMSDPLPPRRLPEPVALDRSCRTDADCTVKDVGNCCGAYPSCVNVDSPTDPEGVQAQCAAAGMASVCGFPAVTGCTCVSGQCEDVTATVPAAE